jgi:uncharacterized protein (TIGR00369 family)
MARTEAETLLWMRATLAELPVAGLLGAAPVAWNGAEGRIAMSFETRPEFCNLMGNVQGGLLTAMLDMAMAFSVLCGIEDGHVVPSLEIKTSFIAPAKQGRILAEGRVVRRGRTIAFMEGRLTDESGNLIATGSATGQIRERARKG